MYYEINTTEDTLWGTFKNDIENGDVLVLFYYISYNIFISIFNNLSHNIIFYIFNFRKFRNK